MIDIFEHRPVLIAGPTASGKSALALHIAETQGGVVINADALQVFDGWRIVTARPSEAELARARHVLYGHIPLDGHYSVGDWLRDVTPYLHGARPIIVGGTGLYLSALTEGLADIPQTPAAVRARADEMSLELMLDTLDAETRARIDQQNPVRVQRAWEVAESTGRSLASWQDETPAPTLPLADVTPLVLDAPKEWLTPRIAQRFEQMLGIGALAEAEAILPNWNPAHQSSKAIGAQELINHLRGDLSVAKATEAAIVASTQYAKRQRTWFNKRMRHWKSIHMPSTDLSTVFTFRT
ncbi:MAG: tRNA (adenosine(37)-N6)-dimethylallyltransferase MiaA [Pseudomonadota bacterium]